MLTTDIQFNANYLTAPASSIVSPRKRANRPRARHSSGVLRADVPQDHVLIQTKSEERWLLPHSSQQRHKGGIGLQTHDENACSVFTTIQLEAAERRRGKDGSGACFQQGHRWDRGSGSPPQHPGLLARRDESKTCFLLARHSLCKIQTTGTVPRQDSSAVRSPCPQ